MSCGDGCYCGLDTRANRIKFIISGVLFVLGWICIFSISGIAARADCVDVPERCDTDTFNDQSTAEFQECENIREQQDDCEHKILPAILFFTFVWWMSWIGCSVPLCMMCCCTKNPHEVPIAQAPVQMYDIGQATAPVGVYAPTQPYANPFLQGAQEPVGVHDGGGVISKPVEGSGDLGVPMYTAQITSGVYPAPQNTKADILNRDDALEDAS